MFIICSEKAYWKKRHCHFCLCQMHFGVTAVWYATEIQKWKTTQCHWAKYLLLFKSPLFSVKPLSRQRRCVCVVGVAFEWAVGTAVGTQADDMFAGAGGYPGKGTVYPADGGWPDGNWGVNGGGGTPVEEKCLGRWMIQGTWRHRHRDGCWCWQCWGLSPLGTFTVQASLVWTSEETPTRVSLLHSALILTRKPNEAGAWWRALLVLNLRISLPTFCSFEMTLVSWSSYLPSSSSPLTVPSLFSPILSLTSTYASYVVAAWWCIWLVLVPELLFSCLLNWRF